ncbi:hypothetical protein ES702_05662 [subsurface metagenome]
MFKDSIDAMTQGFRATSKDKAFWEGLRLAFLSQVTSAMKRDRFNLASVFAAQAQFCREALEASQLHYIAKRDLDLLNRSLSGGWKEVF